MKKTALLLIALVTAFCFSSHAQSVSCPSNVDFELGDYSNWNYYIGSCCPGGTLYTPLQVTTPPGTTLIPCEFALTGPAPAVAPVAVTGIDPYGGFPVVGSGNYSLRVGSARTLYWAEKAEYRVHVPTGVTNYSLVYRYAVVLEDPAGHTASNQPRFTVQAIDSATGTVLPCANSSYTGSTVGTLPGWVGTVTNSYGAIPAACSGSATYGIGSAPSDVYYKPWTTSSLNLSGYSGHTINIQFAAGDCGTGGHFGYGYVDMSCGLFAISVGGGCSGTVQLIAPAGFASYSWYDSATFAIFYGAGDTITVPSTTTTYAVILTPYAGFGCIDTLYTTVSSVAASISGATTLCAGSTTTLSTTGFGGTWSSSNTSVATINSGGIVTGVAIGSTTITYSMPGGCVATATLTVTSPPGPIGSTLYPCVGYFATLTESATGGTWSSSNTSVATITSGGVITGAGAGITVVSYTTACGTATLSLTISSRPMTMPGLIPPLPAQIPLCLGTTIVLSNDGVPTGTWSSSNTAVATIDPITGVMTSTGVAGSTIIYATNLCGGENQGFIFASPGPITGNTILCQNSTTVLSDAVTGGTWSSSNSSAATINSSGVVTGVSVGSTVITYALSGGCMSTTTVTVVAGASAITGVAGICIGSSITLSDATAGGTWSSGSPGVATISTGGTVTGLSVGTTIITYTASGGCTATQTVTVHPPPSAITGSPQVCAGYNITLSNGTPGGTWSCSNTAIATVSSSGQVGGIVAGSATISYSTGAGCTAIWPLTVLSSPGAGTITGLSTLCTGLSVALSDNTSGGSWSSGTTGVATVSASGVVYGVSAGTVVISYSVTSLSCGTATATHLITVTQTPVVSPISGPDSLCVGSVIVLSEMASGGIWGSSNNAVSVVNGSVTGLIAGSDTIAYAVTNACGTASVTKVVTVFAVPPVGIISGISPVCVAATFTMSDGVTGGVWSSGTAVVATIDSVTGIVHTLGAGTTVITYTTGPNGGGCYGIATYTLTVTSAPEFTIGGTVTPVQCYGDNNGSITVMVTGYTPPVRFIWSNTDTTATISNLPPGEYYLNVHETITQCIGIDSFKVTQPDSLQVTDSATQDICHTGSGTITTIVTGGTPPYTYQWSTGSTDGTLENLHSGVYTVTVTDSNGCTKTMTDSVTDNVCSGIVIHDVITPNNDGKNDVWVIEGITQYPSNKVQVYDKWGNMVYEKTGYNNDWEGRGTDGLLPDGTYYYLIKLNTKNLKGGNDTFTGSLLIKR